MAIDSIEDYPYLQTGKIGITPGGVGYLYVPVEPGGIVPAITPPPETVEDYPPLSTMGLAIALDGGVWQLQPTQPGGITEIIPALAPPTNTGAPVAQAVAPPPRVGGMCVCNNGTWSPASPAPIYTRQWQNNNGAIPGATGNTYTLQASDVGLNLNCLVTATNPTGSAMAPSNVLGPVLPLAPVNTTLPAVTGTPQTGSMLIASNGVWQNSPASFTRQWLRGGASIAGATAASYTLVAADEGAMISCIVTAINAGGSTPATSNAVGPITPPARDEARLDDNGGAQSPAPPPRAPAKRPPVKPTRKR